jgi:hypothetical protein
LLRDNKQGASKLPVLLKEKIITETKKKTISKKKNGDLLIWDNITLFHYLKLNAHYKDDQYSQSFKTEDEAETAYKNNKITWKYYSE